MLSRRRDAIRYEYVSQPFEMNRRVVRALFLWLLSPRVTNDVVVQRERQRVRVLNRINHLLS